jgi:hypothetical protein
MISNQSLVYQFLTSQIETAIKSIHIETWSSLRTPSTTSHFNNIPIQTKSNVIKQQQQQQHQRQESIYQKILPPLMSLELDPPFHQQYNTRSRLVPLMSLLLPCYHSPPTESNNARTKFYSNKRICNHFNRNQKCRHHINRYESYRRRQTYKPNPKFINNTVTNVRTTATTQNEANGPEEYETTSINDQNPHDIYTAVDTEMIELS